jgi:type I restriction enzyme S subunit
MSERWKDCIVADIASSDRNALVGGPFGSNLVSKDYVDHGIPVIRGQNMATRWVSGDFVFVSEEKADQLSANWARPGDLVFTQRGTLGQVALVPTGAYDRYVVSQSQMKLTTDLDKAEPLFLYYVFNSPHQLNYIQQNAIQVGVPHTNLGILRNTPISLPPLKTQKKIASILGSLDDKIELNRRMNATLESMAQTIFQSWFIDFDPVHRNAALRTSLASSTSPTSQSTKCDHLFPNSFETSELGPIPTGWRVGSILEEAKLLSGGTPKTSNPEYWGGTIPWASAKDVSQCSDALLVSTERSITELGEKKSATKVIPAFSTVVVSRGATTGRLTMFGIPMAMNQTCYALKSKFDSNFALYCHARKFIEHAVHACHGSVFATITTSTFESTKVLLAPREVQLEFNHLVEPLFQQMLANTHKSIAIATLRESLSQELLRKSDTSRFVHTVNV